MFAKMREKLAGGAKRMQGRTDLLEADRKGLTDDKLTDRAGEHGKKY